MLATAPVKLHLGCGGNILEGFVNVDKFNKKADIQADLINLPFEDGCAEVVYAFHVIEHIHWPLQIPLYEEFYRVLQKGGQLHLGYPEWEVCARNFLNNEGGKKWTWWIQTLYGQQSAPGLEHLSPIVTNHLIEQLVQIGFGEFEHKLDGADSELKCIKTEPLPWF